MRIFICRSNPVAPDPRVEKEARALTEAGYQVCVLGWDRSATLPAEEERDGFQIHRIPIRANYGSGMGNLPRLVIWQVRQFFWLLRRRGELDLLHACDFDTVMPCMALKLLFGKKLVYDIFDFYPDHLRRTPIWVKGLLRALDTRLIDRADAVILVDDSRREQIKMTRPKRLAVIYNSPEDSLPSRTEFRPSVQGRLRVAYVGLFLRERGLLEALAVLKKHPEWELDLAGFGGDTEAIQAASQGMPNVHWHGVVPYDRALALSAQADVLFATYDPAVSNHRYSSPNKLFEAMMLARPIVVARDTNMDRMVNQHECGIVVSYGDVAELEHALQRLAEDLALRELLGKNGRKAYESLYNWDIMKARLLSLYSDTLQTHG